MPFILRRAYAFGERRLHLHLERRDLAQRRAAQRDAPGEAVAHGALDVERGGIARHGISGADQLHGFLVADRLQNLVGSAATPIIFMTASDNPALRERAKKLGAVGFLKKPFDATSLADAIESALSPGDNWRPSIAV